MSSCEAEVKAWSEVYRELMWICRFLDEISIEYHKPDIYCDLPFCRGPVQHQRNKHVESKYCYCRDLVTDDKVRIYQIHTNLNCADIMTKSVGKQIMERLMRVTMEHQLMTFEGCDRKGAR